MTVRTEWAARGRPGHLVALLGVAMALCAGASRAADPVPIEHFFKTPAMSGAVVSPDGTKAALAIAGPDGNTALAVVELASPKKIKGVAGIDGGGVHGIQWVNDQRVVFNEFDFRRGNGDQLGYRLYGVNVDGSDFKRLIGLVDKSTTTRDRPLSARNRLAVLVRDGSNDVLVTRCNPVAERGGGALGGYKCQILLDRLNTMAVGASPLTPTAPENAQGWLADGKGHPRLMTTVDEDRLSYHWREADGRWRKLAELDMLGENGLAWGPLQLGADGKLYVVANTGKDGENVLTTLDLATGRPDPKPLVSIEGYDFSGSLVWDLPSKKLIGVRYTSDAAGTAWLDASMRELQTKVDELLPGTINILQCGVVCLSARQVWVTAYSDLQPAVYFVYDRDTKQLDLVGASRPWIDAKRSASRDLVRVKVRDGLMVPVHVTKPRDAKGPLPTVVLVHGGPYVPGDDWGWDAQAQFLASRGYLVVEPDYRGTQRYGFKHFKAGWKQWGLKMQDDITDVTNWAVAQGLADGKRLVIAGASYGGYATMMGLVREPELYRAGINWVGVTDIVHWYNHPYSDLGDFGMRFYLPRVIGDLDKDRAQLEATSPVKQAARIKRPVLMAYGEQDLRVPITHGREMLAALKANGSPVEWIEYADEGHGWSKLANNVDFWSRVERFLAEHTK